jgi:hypothetical protein
MRRKAPHSMMQVEASTHPPEGSPRPTTPPGRQKGSSKASPDLRKLRGRTSRLEPPASDPRQTRSACNGIQHHRPCGSSHGRKRQGQTTDAIDTKTHECQSRGCSQTLLYNHHRPHDALGLGVPADRYRPSLRSFKPTVEPFGYGPDDVVRSVDVAANISFQGRRLKASKALVGKHVAIRPTARDGVFDLVFRHVTVKSIDFHNPA